MKLPSWHKMVKKYYDGTDLLKPPLLVQNNSPLNHIYSGQAKAISDEAKKIMTMTPKFTIEPQPLKYLGDKKKTIGYPKGEDAIAKQQDAYLKKKKEQKSALNKLMKTNNEVVTKEYHIYASHPSEFKDCKACRVILNFLKWQKKSIPSHPGPPKDTYASWANAAIQPTSVIVHDPLIKPHPTTKKINILKVGQFTAFDLTDATHAIICTCKQCKEQGTGSYTGEGDIGWE